MTQTAHTAPAAWFVCRAKGIVGDVMLPLKAGVDANDPRIAARGRMPAARRFKKEHDLHPCTKVEVEFQFVDPMGAAPDAA